MLPFLLITLHFSQIGLTDDLTFTVNPPFKKSPFIIIAPYIKYIKYKIIFSDLFFYSFNQFEYYLSLQIILPFDKSYGDNSIVTLSPGNILI